MRSALFISPLIISLALAACSKSPTISAPPQPQSYHVRGILQSINFAAQTATIEHEEIPGYMDAMTMPFDVKSMAEVQALHAGDPVSFELVVTETTSWIEGVQRLNGPTKALRSAPAETSKVARLKEGDRCPDFRLVDDHGREITQETFAGKPLLVSFIFTRCPLPNFCPLMSRNFSAIRAGVASDPVVAADLRFLSISFDPEFDTPAILRQYSRLYTQDHDTWRFAAGTPAQVEALTKAFSVYVQRDQGTFSHGLCTALIGPDGVIRQIWRGNSWNPAEAVSAVREIAAERSQIAGNE